MLDQSFKTATSRMQKSLTAFQHDLATVRTGRAHPSLLQNIMVDYYGTATALQQVANVAVADSRTLTVTPWEKGMVAAVEKAIMTSDLGLNPSSAGLVIRIPLPALTEERRRELVKSVKDMGEAARVSVRNIRRDANNEAKKLLKNKEVSEDEVHQSEDKIQKLTDKFVGEVDKLLAEKEQELMQV
jgi:ribosome recycling factor